jgi:hypothetical protein
MYVYIDIRSPRRKEQEGFSAFILLLLFYSAAAITANTTITSTSTPAFRKL